ncbi:MAG: molybdopterin oxidoreductase [Clostridiales bacterium]|nr:molybdopterin oxidoreductase [Clostridiales bacterium]
MLKTFGALPTEARAREMTHRDYLWCALNLLLDSEEELERLCPACRAEAESDRCPVCGAERSDWGENPGFDRAAFERMRGESG